MRMTSLRLNPDDGRAHMSIMTLTVALWFFFCAFGWTCFGAEAVGGPLHRGDCALPPLKWEESWGKLFNRIPTNTQRSLLLGDFSLKGLRFYARQTSYQVP